MYISGHPLDDVKETWKKNVNAFTSDFVYQEDLEGSKLKDKETVKIGGIISGVNTRLTKKKETMAIVTLEDLRGSVEMMVFPKAYEKVKKYLKNDELVFASGRVNTEDEADSKLIVENMSSFDEVPKTLWLKFDDMETYEKLWPRVLEVLSNNKGIDNINIRVIKEDKIKKLPDSFRTYADAELTGLLEGILGDGAVVVR